MSLTGNIEVFPLQEVLRLLARSSKNGCLRVESGSVHGRIYLDDGALTLATIESDRDIMEQLDAAGLVGESVHRMDAGEVYLPEHLGDRNPSDLTDFVREHVVESLYRMRKPGTGSFEFLVDATSRFRTGQTFDAEVAVTEADRRASDWLDIEETVSDLLRPVRMVRELAQSEVSVNSATWRVLASLDGGASVENISRVLGMTRFRSAREIAGLMRSGLVEYVPDEHRAPTSGWSDESPVQDLSEVAVAVDDEPVDAVGDTTPPSPWDSNQETDWQGSSWTDDSADDAASVEDEATEHDDQTADAGIGEETDTGSETAAASGGGWWAEAMGSNESEADTPTTDDADAFLESVFSQLDGGNGGSDDEEETGFSMGLLRRRRMGPLSKDITESD